MMDPICACEVDEKTAEFKTHYKGRTYFFCSSSCKAKFDRSPDHWVKQTAYTTPADTADR